MSSGISNRYAVYCLLAAVFTIAGAWLPSVRKLPTGYVNGHPYTTGEGLPPAQIGLVPTDVIIVVPVIVILVAIIIASYKRFPVNFVLIIGGATIVLFGINTFILYFGIHRYAPDIGTYLTIIGGLLFLFTALYHMAVIDSVRTNIGSQMSGLFR